MNNGELKIFNYKNNEVRTTIKDGEIWWVLKDVCKILGLNDAHKVAYCVLKKMSGIRFRSPIILVGLKVQPQLTNPVYTKSYCVPISPKPKNL